MSFFSRLPSLLAEIKPAAGVLVPTDVRGDEAVYSFS